MFFNTDQLSDRTPFVLFNFENNDVSIDLKVFEKLFYEVFGMFQKLSKFVNKHLVNEECFR